MDFDIKRLVKKVLTKLEADKIRGRSMDIDDFMWVLHGFNSVIIHFR